MLDGSPIGTVIAWSGPLTSSGPTGPYLLCDGTAVSRSLYSELFSTIGTTYGNGDGVNTFNLPNIKTKVIAGYDSTDTSFNTIGLTGGSSNTTLIANNLPTHTHNNTLSNNTVASSTHTHTSWLGLAVGAGGSLLVPQPQSMTVVSPPAFATGTSSNAGVNIGFASIGANDLYQQTSSAPSATTTVTITNGTNTTTNTAINNLQPYIVMRYYIKYTAGGTSFGPTGPTGPTITNATTVTVTDVSNNVTYYPTLTLNSGTNQSLYADITSVPLSYNPSTGALSTTTFVGDLSGNITGGLGGQVLYQSAVNTTAKLANGTAGQVLVSAGTTLAPVWSNAEKKPFAYLSLVYYGVSYASGATVNMPLTALTGGYIWGGNGFSAPTGTSLFLPETGYYQITATLTMLNNSLSPAGTGYMYFALYKNGADIATNGTLTGNSGGFCVLSNNYSGSNTVYETISTTGIVKCTTASTDYLSFFISNSTSATQYFYGMNVNVVKINDL